MSKHNAESTCIAIRNGILGGVVGVALSMPSVMAFDAAPHVAPSMVLIGCSGLSVIPITIIATTLTISTGDLKYQSLYALPACGIMIGVLWDRKLNQQVVLSNVSTKHK